MNYTVKRKCAFSKWKLLSLVLLATVIAMYSIFVFGIGISLAQNPDASINAFIAFIGLVLIFLYLLDSIYNYIKFNTCLDW